MWFWHVRVINLQQSNPGFMIIPSKSLIDSGIKCTEELYDVWWVRITCVSMMWPNCMQFETQIIEFPWSSVFYSSPQGQCPGLDNPSFFSPICTSRGRTSALTLFVIQQVNPLTFSCGLCSVTCPFETHNQQENLRANIPWKSYLLLGYVST